MRAVIQRVKNASVSIDGSEYSSIGPGILAFVAVRPEDTDKDLDYLLSKIPNLRIFEDENGKMNLSVKDIGGEILIVSQFTLYGDCRHGRRPGFSRAGDPKEAELIYNKFVDRIKNEPVTVKTGKFQADMNVSLINDGPVTLLLDSEKVF